MSLEQSKKNLSFCRLGASKVRLESFPVAEKYHDSVANLASLDLTSMNVAANGDRMNLKIVSCLLDGESWIAGHLKDSLVCLCSKELDIMLSSVMDF